ncbi:glutaminase [Streptomyces yatensis]|uniref:glutaminase n=1 Tax=Streptomyces yatensis TaxID=155177 RepID=A0ABN2IWW8_9ACTN|nr:glutaminase [Streptomyces yatensis]
MSTAPSPLPDPRPAPADPPDLPRRNTLAAPAGRDAVGTDFDGFTAAVADIHRRLLPDRRGRVAGHLPAPSQAGPDRFAVSVCTVGGQRFSVGDSRTPFAVQSVCKPVNYLMALDEHGPEVVHQHVGHEPGGHGFAAPTLTPDGRPPNPMTNSGAITTCSLLEPRHDPETRFARVLDTWRRLYGGTTAPEFDEEGLHSEKSTLVRDIALSHWLRELDALPPGTGLKETLSFYLTCCSIQLDTHALSAAATLAGGGRNPVTGERVVSAVSVRRCLAMMAACGLYDSSVEFAYTVGLPAKSGVSGALMVVIPQVMGVCVWSPRLDGRGNSVRGVEFCRELVSRFAFHMYDIPGEGDH